jgi:dolichyl-phosphooligosaccharide-protein glycotransferase
MPAVLGTLTLIPVYFIGRELFNRWAGLIAAALVAILPSELMHRSLLGFTDHHVAEVLFSTTSVLFLILAVRRAREREISFHHLLTRDWPAIRRPLIYALLAGLFLGFYLLTWQGGLMFIFIIFAYLVVQFIVDHLRQQINRLSLPYRHAPLPCCLADASAGLGAGGIDGAFPRISARGHNRPGSP